MSSGGRVRIRYRDATGLVPSGGCEEDCVKSECVLRPNSATIWMPKTSEKHLVVAFMGPRA
jgi:hypothetical protein